METYSLVDFGARGDGKFDNTEVFAAAFAALKEGDRLNIGKGTYRSGPITLSGRNITLVFEKGAGIQFIADEDLYTPVFSRWEGVNCYCMHPCFLITESDGIHIKGDGILDGNGLWWWEKAKQVKSDPKRGPVSTMEKILAAHNPGYESQSGGGGGRHSQFLRPPLLQILKSNNIQLDGLTLTNSPFWTLHPLYSTNIILRNLHVLNPKDAPNTDGIDIDSCRFVTVKECVVDVGDDGIALKSGSGPDGISVNLPTTDVLIESCTVKNAHGGAVIGSETAAGLHDITVKDCLFDGTDRGIRIKTRRGRGGVITDLVFSRLRMRANLCPLTMNMYYRCGSLDPEDFSLLEKPVVPTTPRIAHVLIEDCIAEASTSSAAFIAGLPESPIQDVEIRNCRFSIAQDGLMPTEESEMYEGLPSVQERGIRARNVELRLLNVEVEGDMTAVLKEVGVTIIE
ncbi:MAG: glycoside hydrolase family 28 protein [Sphaerochaeta sp.]|uniref:glycoside hydrolase family 28 protein n=1 Tax=Sphaerochaeta sp. TaxID=1972642 RepID=UPI003D0AF5FE